MSEFIGCYTALVTPFKDNKIDYKSLEELVEFQIAGNVDGIVAVGTTGESPTLNHQDHSDVITFIIKIVAGRCKVIAGTGANSTQEAITLTKAAAEAGADGSLQVTPYYNKPTQEGLYQHFKAIAEATDMPVVLYNVPGRSAMEISLDTVIRLSELPTITAIKEAAGSVDRVSQIVQACPNLTVLSGDDGLTLPMMSVGAKGVISVLSNILPAETTALTHYALEGNYPEALKLHQKYYQLMNDMFLESNPIPVKAALGLMGKLDEEYRLPLCPISAGNRQVLIDSMKNVGMQF